MATKKDDLKALCSEIAARHGYKSDMYSVGLELLAIETISHDPIFSDSILESEEGADGVFSNWHAGGANEHGVDGLIYNDELTNIAVIQTKWKTGKIDETSRSEARDFFSRIPAWADTLRRENFNSETQRLLDESQFSPRDQVIDLYFITNQTTDSLDHLNIAEDATDQYQAQGLNVKCHFLTFAELNQLVADSRSSRRDTSVKEVSIQFPRSNYFMCQPGEMRVLVLTVKAQQVAEIYNRKGVGVNLFNSNVRAALATGKVNPEMVETARDDERSPFFYYYNNGITATCSSFELDEKSNQVHATNLQVINGAQTVSALVKAVARNKNSKAYVLLTIIETEDHYRNKNNVAEKITRFRNTQNPVKASDFFSNEPFQKWIAEQIDKASGKALPPLRYEYKRGVKSDKRKKITIEELAYLRYACLENAPFTYITAKDIWDSTDPNSNFWKAFGRKGLGVSVWTEEELEEVFWMIRTWLQLRQQATQMNSDFKKSKSDNPERKYLSVLARYVTALTYNVLAVLRNRGVFSSFSEFNGGSKEMKEVEARVMKIARIAIKNNLESWNVANPRLNMPQDIPTWEMLIKNVVADYDFETDLLK